MIRTGTEVIHLMEYAKYDWTSSIFEAVYPVVDRPVRSTNLVVLTSMLATGS